MKRVGQLADGLAVFLRAADDLVVDVGDVAHVVQLIAAGAQPARDHVEHHHHAGMAQMAKVIHGHAAHVHVDMTRSDRNESLRFAGEGVVYLQHGKG
jgi:hypothetical protein